MKSIKVDRVMSFDPCAEYPRDVIVALFAGRDSLSAQEILALDIPAKDRIWLVCQEGVLDPDIHDRWIEIVVTRAVTDHALHCGIAQVEEWARTWLSGEDRTAEAADAAAEAAYAAAKAADNATRAAYTTIRAAFAAYAADAAAEAADASYSAERDLQVADLLSIIGGGVA